MRSLAPLALAAVLAPMATAGTSTAERARLTIVESMPLIVAGTGFGSGESVRVTASVNAKNETRRVSAGGTGKLRVRFAIGSTTCAMVTVIAVGARGSRAAVKIVPVCAEPGPIG